MTDPLLLDALGQAAALRAGEVSPTELVTAALQRIQDEDPGINALSWLRGEQALAEAAELERRGWEGAPAFAGVPLLLKDHRCWAEGEETRFGTTALEETPSPWDSTTNVHTALADLGFVVVGRTTTPEFATALVTESVATGVTRNPRAPDRTSSGSSGGSASAVAAGMVAVAHATDGGGSIRCPASACGLVGLKPSRGRVSMGPEGGESWAGATVEGVLARTVRDAAAVTSGIARWFPGDPYVAPGAIPAAPGPMPEQLRVGVMDRAPDGSPWASPEVADAVRRVADVLADRGHEVAVSAPSALSEGEFAQHYDRMVSTDVELLARRIEHRIGRPFEPGELAPRNEGRRAQAGALAATDYLASRLWLGSWTSRLQSWWHGGGFDVLLLPTLGDLPALAGPDEIDDDSIVARSMGMQPMTSFANVGGLPAISLPLAESVDGVPIGVQLVAAFGREDLLLALAAHFELQGPWLATTPSSRTRPS